MLQIDYKQLPVSKYSIKCPFKMKPTRIVIHNTGNDASAENEIAFMHRNDEEKSFHYAVDDKNIIQGLPLDRNGWHAGDGNGKGNREGIAIEICYSKSGGEKFKKAQENSAELTAYLLKQYGWGLDKITKHQDYNPKKCCPHRTLSDYGWQFFIDLVASYMGNTEKPIQTVTSTTTPTADEHIYVTYQTWDDVKNKWLPNVVGKSDYAGIFGDDVCCVFANLSQGNITLAVHPKGGKWLPEVRNREDYAGIFNKPIDGIMVKTDTGKTIKYRVHLRKRAYWLPAVTGYDVNNNNNGFAGILGQEIDGIQMWIE